MYTSVNAILSSLAFVGLAAAATHTIEVGNGGALAFNPNSTTAAVGDMLEFVFYPKNHSVVQSTFANPCESTQGFYSGYMPVAANETGNMTFMVEVNDTKPIWFYCSQAAAGGHCAKGMVGCVNCPTTNNTLAAFMAKAMNTTNATVTHPASVQGGTFMALSENGTTTNSSGTSTASPSASATNGAAAFGINKWSLLTVGAGLCGMAAMF